MATHTIGSGGNFSTVQAWEDDIPATLTEPRIGQVKNGELTTAGTLCTFSAHATTVTNEIILETESGASFQDHANVRTNALRYNTANGAGLRTTSTYAPVILISGVTPHLTIRKLQMKVDASGTTNAVIRWDGFHANTAHVYKDLILEKMAGVEPVVLVSGTGSTATKLINVVVITRQTTNNGITSTAGNNQFIGCTVIRPSNITAGGTGIVRTHDTPKMVNCAIFGFTTSNSAAGFDGASSNNATDLASGLPGTSNQHSVTYSATTPFVNATDASSAHDFRLANDANALINNGVLDATNAPNDISATVRASSPEIGVWELVSGVAPLTINVID